MIYLLGELVNKIGVGGLARLPSREEMLEAIDAISKKKDLVFLPLAGAIKGVLYSCPYLY